MEKKEMSNHWDVIVIGAGMAGLLTAYYLQEQGKRVLVLEAAETASGQTGRTTAKITSQHGLKYSTLIHTVGEKKARLYAQANEAAIREYARLVKSQNVECQFERVPAFLYTMQDTEKLKEEAKAALLLGIDAFITEHTELPFPNVEALCFPEQAQFAPLQFVRWIAGKLEILEHTPVLAVRGNRVITDKGVWTADDIVMATHYPFRNVPGFYFMRQHQERSYVLALSGCRKIEGMYYSIDPEGLSLRQMGDLLLLGGGAARTGEPKVDGSYAFLRETAKRYFPEGKEEGIWSAQDCMPHDGIPFIGKYSVFTPNLYVATGFQKWGMTSSMIAALILRDLICGIENPYAEVFSPQRLNLRAAAGGFLTDMGVSVKGLLKGRLRKTVPRCSHLGCELVWNPEEHTWECPCHGSRFTAMGGLLDNPSQSEITMNYHFGQDSSE